MGFYIRKGLNFGPLRLNLSRSGLGASFGVKGARIGIGPRGSYVHIGRGGLYYRQTLGSAHQQPAPLPSGMMPPPSAPSQTIIVDGLQEISSTSAVGIVDSSAGQLLQELNRVKKRKDLFPIFGLAGAALSCRLFILGVQWWVLVVDILCVMGLALVARNNDVTNGTAIVNYTFAGDSGQSFAALRNAFTQWAGSCGFWHVLAAGATDDWKRNAGATSVERRTSSRLHFSRPPKVECNIDVPTFSIDQRSLYFFPDRLLVYDSSGVGAVSYADLNTQTGRTRFAEDGSVPSDAKQVGSTWRYVNRSGGPDRRFNNNRQLPVLLYGELSLTSPSGLNELFQYSVPDNGAIFAAAITKLRESSQTAGYAADENRDSATSGGKGTAAKVLIWTSLVLMVSLFIFLPWSASNLNPSDAESAQERAIAKQDQARREFVNGLNQRFLTEHMAATVISVNNSLTLRLSKEGLQAARRDGVEPFVKNVFFNRILQPNTELTLCNLGFQTLSVTMNSGPPKTVSLSCAASP